MKQYAVHKIKEVNGIRQFEKDGTPVLEEKPEKLVRLQPETIKILNDNSRNFGKVYVVVEEKPKAESKADVEPLEFEKLEKRIEKPIQPIKPKVKSNKRKK